MKNEKGRELQQFYCPNCGHSKIFVKIEKKRLEGCWNCDMILQPIID